MASDQRAMLVTPLQVSPPQSITHSVVLPVQGRGEALHASQPLIAAQALHDTPHLCAWNALRTGRRMQDNGSWVWDVKYRP